MRRLVSTTVAVALASGAVGVSAANQSGTPVVATRLNEENPAAGGGYLAYSQNSRRRPKHYDAYVRYGHGRPLRLNARGTEGWIGGISGTTLVYQQAVRTRSDLEFFDLASRKRSGAPPGFNTRRWEWHPSVSGDWVLYGRSAADMDYMILRSISSGRQIVLDTVADASSSFDLAPGQVNGNYAVWTKCDGSACNAYRYAIAEGVTTQLPAPKGTVHYGTSVDGSGTVYVGRSGRGCGNHVELWRYPLVGLPTLLLSFPPGQDFRFSYAAAAASAPSTTDVYYDRVVCRRKAWDIYKVVDASGPTP